MVDYPIISHLEVHIDCIAHICSVIVVQEENVKKSSCEYFFSYHLKMFSPGLRALE